MGDTAVEIGTTTDWTFGEKNETITVQEEMFLTKRGGQIHVFSNHDLHRKADIKIAKPCCELFWIEIGKIAQDQMSFEQAKIKIKALVKQFSNEP